MYPIPIWVTVTFWDHGYIFDATVGFVRHLFKEIQVTFDIKAIPKYTGIIQTLLQPV